MSKTMLNIKTDTETKLAAQRIAKEIGVPLSTVVNAQLKKFIRERKVELIAPFEPNARTQKLLDEAEKEFTKGKSHGPSKSVEALIESLEA